MKELAILVCMTTFLLISPMINAQNITLTRNDYYVKMVHVFYYYKNGTATLTESFFFSPTVDILNYSQHGYLITPLSNKYVATPPFEGTCTLITSTGGQIPMVETGSSLGVFNYVTPFAIPLPPSPVALEDSIFCIVQNNGNNKVGNISLGAFEVANIPDETEITINIEKSTSFIPFFQKYYFLDWQNHGSTVYSLDSLNPNFYVLNAHVTNPRQVFDVKISFKQTFDWNSWISDNIISVLVFTSIGVILDKGWKRIKTIPSLVKKLISRKSTSPSQHLPSKS